MTHQMKNIALQNDLLANLIILLANHVIKMSGI